MFLANGKETIILIKKFGVGRFMVGCQLVLIAEGDFSTKPSRKARKLFNSIYFVNWICLCMLFRLLKKISTEVGSVKVAKQSSMRW